MRFLERKEGITLIALVITIIIMIILAGVSINAVVGDNGILTNAIEAARLADITDIKEQIELALIGNLDDSGNYTVKNVLDAAKEVTGNDVDTENKTVQTPKGNTLDLSDILDGAVISWYYYDDETVTNGTTYLTIGEYINYNPESNREYISETETNGHSQQTFNTNDYTGKWQILGADEDTGELLIISSSVISDSFYLYSKIGYEHCENELNAICSIYGSGYGATGARSISVEDINKLTKYNPENLDGAGTKFGEETVYEYGIEVTYSWDGTQKPAYSTTNGYDGNLGTYHQSGFSYYLNGWQYSEYTTEKNVITTLSMNAYWYYGSDYLEQGSIIFDMLFNIDSYYWLSSTCVAFHTRFANFASFFVSAFDGDYGYVDWNCIGYSLGTPSYFDASNYGVRAVVSIDSSTTLICTEDSGWNIQ